MGRYKATVTLIRNGKVAGSRSFDDPRTAAAHLGMLMRLGGFQGDQSEAVATLADGIPLSHKGLEYRVADTEEHQEAP